MTVKSKDLPKALALADELDFGIGTIDTARHKAAEELRRLHHMCKALEDLIYQLDQHEGQEHWSNDLRVKLNKLYAKDIDA